MSGSYPQYSARVTQAISGDDLMTFVELVTDDLYKKVRVRLDGVDTPDGYKQPKSTPAGAIREEVYGLAHGKDCKMDVVKQSRKYWIVILHIPQEGGGFMNLNEYLKEKGFTYPRDKSNAQKKVSQGGQ